MILILKILNSSISTKEKSMPIFRKIIFGTGGPTRVRPAPMGVFARPSEDTTLYTFLEDNSDWLVTETNVPFISE